jgi:predicted amidohydrolase YtcJ
VKLPVIAVVLAIVLSVVVRGAGQPSTATTIVVGGAIYTANPKQPKVEALAIAGDRILRVGTRRDIEALGGPATRVVDLAGATVVPGLEDAHGHVLGLGDALERLDLTEAPDVAHIAKLVADHAPSMAGGVWILGRGWDQNHWPVKAWPTATDLDAASGDHPVALERVDGHATWVNSRAMALAGITKGTPDPSGGRLIRDASGAPTGVLVDTAQSLVERAIPDATPKEIDARILAADRELSRVGLTMVHDAGATLATIAAYQRLGAAHRLHTRLYVMISDSTEARREWFARGPLVDPSQRLNVRAIKMYADGALGSRGAALLADYNDEPGNRGLLVTPPEALETTTKAAATAGFQPCTHAIGDRANREMLDIYQRVEVEVPGMRALRPRIEHAQILSSPDIPRFATLGVIASMQPTHCTSDMPWAPTRLGAARVAEGAYVWQKLLKSGARLAAGSDFPVERPDPLPGFYAAITRQDKHGQPPGGWAPDQRLSRDEALAAFTIDAAYAAQAEHDLGSLEPGKLADFVVLSRDIMTAPPAGILSTTVLATVVGGATVYSAPNSPLGTAR